MSNLSVKIGELELQNPVILASGTCGVEIAQFTNLSKIGAIITKSITLEPRLGNLPPRTVETCGGMLNSIGLENLGVREFISYKLKEWLELGIPVIASVAGKTQDEYLEVIKMLEPTNISGFEINISCPNVEGVEFCKYPNIVKELTYAIKGVTSKAVIVKLSPNVSNIQAVAIAAEQGGADAISLINTIYGLKVDVESRNSMLGGVTGGLSGPCIKPVALYYVYKVSQVCKIPIIGMGGIMSTCDALEFIIVGATAIEIGTSTFVNPNTAAEIVVGIEDYCMQHKIDSIQKLIGTRKFS
ncbi:MAG: dihydroorotate dehydrogenase [Candidatus Stahlbacteria bacterium]|nr:dihydroorotate dehydrogenase [Candidatus Stahlbacteria bacterium]